MPVITAKISDNEYETMLRRMQKSGETNRSAHIRRVYFDGEDSNEALMGDIKKQLADLTDATNRSQKLLGKLADLRTDQLEMSVLSALFVLLYQSVEPAVQATVDRYIDFKGVESFLQKGGK